MRVTLSRGIGIAAVPQLPKLVTGVQLPYPALLILHFAFFHFASCNLFSKA